MRPDAPHDPSVELIEELSDVGSFVILAPSPQKWVKFRNQLLGVQRHPPLSCRTCTAYNKMGTTPARRAPKKYNRTLNSLRFVTFHRHKSPACHELRGVTNHFFGLDSGGTIPFAR